MCVCVCVGGGGGGGGMCPLLKESVKARDILYANINFYAGMSYELHCLYIKQNFHENGLIIVVH